MADVTVAAIKLTRVEVQSERQVQCLRVIRNAGRFGYSNDTEEISAPAQREWWRRSQGKVHAWLYSVAGEIVAYGMFFQRDDGSWSPSAGVLPDYQGRGYGGRIVDDLVARARELGVQLVAAARLDNPAAVATHHPDLWERLEDSATHAHFRMSP
jgi:GNAT superfamily N-acetyltransferase